MKYMILIYMSDAIERAITADGALDELDATHGAVIGELTTSGELVGSHELAVPDAKVVRTSGGLSVTDGPYAETTEWVGGYYLIDARDEDRAIAIAARFVEARYGTVEIRRIVA